MARWDKNHDHSDWEKRTASRIYTQPAAIFDIYQCSASATEEQQAGKR